MEVVVPTMYIVLKNSNVQTEAKMETAEEDGHEVDARVECKAESTSTAVNQ